MPEVLVCGGLPRSATTYIYNELRNYENVFRSVVKESFLFERSDRFIDWKLGQLKNGTIYLDFTPEYIFSRSSLQKISRRKMKCFFVLRDFESYRASLEKYLAMNGIKNDLLERLDRETFQTATRYAADHFPTIAYDEISKGDIAVALSKMFGLDLGGKIGNAEVRNASSERQHFTKALIHNRLAGIQRRATSLAFGLI